MNNPLHTPEIISLSGRATAVSKNGSEIILDEVNRTDLLPNDHKKAFYIRTTHGLLVIPMRYLPDVIRLRRAPSLWVGKIPGAEMLKFHAQYRRWGTDSVFHRQSLPVMNQLIHKYLKKGRLQ